MTEPAAIAEALRRDGFSDPLPAKGQVWELPLAYLEPQQRHLSMITAISNTTAGWQCRVQAWIEDPRSRSMPERRDGVLYVARLVDQYRPVWCPVPHPDGDPARPCIKLIPKGWAQDEGHAGGHMWMSEDTAAILDGGHFDATGAISGQPFSGHLPEDCTPECPKWFPL